MSSKLIAGNATNGSSLSADTTGILEIQTGATPTTAITVDASQNVGIGTSTPSSKLSFGQTGSSQVGSQILLYDGGSASNTNNYGFAMNPATGELSTSAGVSGYITWYTGTRSERMRIDSSGNLLLNVTAPFQSGLQCVQFDGAAKNGIALKTTLASTGSNYLHFSNSAGNTAGYVTQNGTTTVAYTTSSDYRLKENIAPMTGALDKVSALKPVTYDWKDGGSSQGFIAHELQEVCPESVVGKKDAVDAEGNPQYQGIDTSFLVATLTAAIQELNAKVTALETQLGAK